MNRPFKLGLDVHGVCANNPEVFGPLTKLLVNAGAEVHIITGKRFSPDFKRQLMNYGLIWTHFFSIAEQLKKDGVRPSNDDSENPHFDDKDAWDRAKARYCAEQGIDLHLDDGDNYIPHFTTPVARFHSTHVYADGVVVPKNAVVAHTRWSSQ